MLVTLYIILDSYILLDKTHLFMYIIHKLIEEYKVPRFMYFFCRGQVLSPTVYYLGEASDLSSCLPFFMSWGDFFFIYGRPTYPILPYPTTSIYLSILMTLYRSLE